MRRFVLLTMLLFTPLLLGAKWVRPTLRQLGKPAIAGVRVDDVEAWFAEDVLEAAKSAGVLMNAEASPTFHGGRRVKFWRSEFAWLEFVGVGEDCYAIGGEIENHDARGPEVGELVAFGPTGKWYTTDRPDVYWKNHRDFRGIHGELWWIRDFRRFQIERGLVSKIGYRANLVGLIDAGDLEGARDIAVSGRPWEWEKEVAEPLVTELGKRMAEVTKRLDAGEPPEDLAIEALALWRAHPGNRPVGTRGQGRNKSFRPGQKETILEMVKIADALEAEVEQAEKAGALATAAGLSYLRVRLYGVDGTPQDVREAFGDRLLAAAPQLRLVPAQNAIQVGEVPEALEEAESVLKKQAYHTQKDIPILSVLPAGNGRLEVVGALETDLSARTYQGEERETVRTFRVVDNRAAVERWAEHLTRLQPDLSELEYCRGLSASADAQVTSSSTSSRTRTEQFRDCDLIVDTMYCTSGVRDVTTTTTTAARPSPTAGVLKQQASRCYETYEAGMRQARLVAGPRPPDYLREDDVRTVVRKGEWQVWSGTLKRQLRYTEPDGHVTTLEQSLPVELAPRLRGRAGDRRVDEWLSRDQALARATDQLDERLVDALYDVLDERIERKVGTLPERWRGTERRWARWLFGDGPAPAPERRKPSMTIYHHSVTPMEKRYEAARGRLDAGIVAMVPANGDYLLASTTSERGYALTRPFQHPVAELVIDATPILRVPDREAVVITDQGVASVLETSGRPEHWKRVGAPAPVKGLPVGFTPDGRVFLTEVPDAGGALWNPLTGEHELLDGPEQLYPSVEAGKAWFLRDGDLYLRDLSSGDAELVIPHAAKDGSRIMQRGDGRVLWTMDGDTTRVWDLWRRTLIEGGGPGKIYMRPDGQFIDGELWTVPDGQNLRRIQGGVSDGAFARDPSLRR